MPKFNCKCGFTQNISAGWFDCEIVILKQMDVEEAGELIERSSTINEEIFLDFIDERKIVAYKCPECQRIYIETDRANNNFQCYALETCE